MKEFSPRAMSPEQVFLVFMHNGDESSVVRPSENQSALGGPEVIQELPQTTETATVGETTESLEVFIKLPQINLISA